MKKKDTFDSPYKQHAERNGQPFEIVKTIDKPDSEHDVAVLPMYGIRFEDGEEIEAWPEEVYHVGE